MASILLPPCIAAKSLVASSIPIAQSSIALAAGYAAGVAPVVASLTTVTTTLAGVTAILGYTDVDSSNEGSNDTKDGSAWYIGANMSF